MVLTALITCSVLFIDLYKHPLFHHKSNMYKVAILGHSFVSGLEHHLRNRGVYTAEQIAEAMKMTMYVLQVFIFGSCGALVTDSNFVFPFVQLQRLLPTVVVFNYGTNDLANNVPPLQAAVKVVDMAKDLLTQMPLSNMLWYGCML